MTQPIDLDIRRSAAQGIERSVALSAGAGAGKTSVLVERLTSHLLAGTPPRHIAAITFTRMATTELATRSRDVLEEKLIDARRNNDLVLQTQINDILGNFGDLTISTIHSFCQDLLVREALEARWAPDTQADQTQGLILHQTLMEPWLRDFETRRPTEALWLRLLGASHALEGLARTLTANRDLTVLRAEEAPIDTTQIRLDLEDFLNQLEALLPLCKVPDTCTLHSCCLTQRSILREVLTIEELDQLAIQVITANFKAIQLKPGKATDWDSDGKARVQQLRRDMEAWQQTFSTRFGLQLHRIVVEELDTHYLSALSHARQEQGRADFSDLLFQSQLLLRSNASARRRLAQRYQVLLIDEVQDTDPIQAEVAALLTRDPEDTGSWRASTPRPGSLFAVGDPKQSIYRFRRADVEVWRQLQTLIKRSGQTLDLQQNFRSVPGIVSWVNHTFAELPDFTPQVAHRTPATLDPVTLIDVQESQGENENTALARHLASLKANGTTIYDKATGQLRPVEDRDFLILIPAWTKATELHETLLKTGIQCTIVGGKGLGGRDEIKLLINAMEAIEEPQHAQAVVSVLRGLFGLSIETLVDHHQRGGTWSTISFSQPAGPTGEALKLLGKLHGLRHKHSWIDLLDELLEHTGVLAVWAMTMRRWSILANLDKFKTHLRALEPQTRSSAEVLTMLQAVLKDDSEEQSLKDDDHQTARIMTHFGAKGLEAPVVALVHAQRKLTIDHAIIRDEHHEALAIPAGKHLPPPDWTAHKDAETLAQREEHRRWIYVATTRARDHLVLVRSDKNSKLFKDTDVKRGIPPTPTPPEHHGQMEVIAPGVEVRTLAASALPVAPTHESTFRDDLDPRVDALLAAPIGHRGDPEGESRARRVKAAMSASRRASSRWRSVGNLVGSQEPSEESGGIGPEGGTVVHRVMEHLDLGQPDDVLRARVPGLTRAFAAMAGIHPEKARQCQEVIMGLLGHEVIAEARRAPERWREVPFAYHEAGTVITGRIDLCFPTDASRTTWKVVDWKSHLPAPGTTAHQRYSQQLAHYARAILATVTPCRHVDTVLAGPHQEIGLADTTNELIEIVHESLADLVADLCQRGHAPEVGHEPGVSTYVELELAWPHLKSGLGLDLTTDEQKALEDAGWRVASVDTSGVLWPTEAADAVYELLDLAMVDAAAQDDIHEAFRDEDDEDGPNVEGSDE